MPRIDLVKPCLLTKFCPYGPLGELSPVPKPNPSNDKICAIYGHECPVFKNAEAWSNGGELIHG